MGYMAVGEIEALTSLRSAGPDFRRGFREMEHRAGRHLVRSAQRGMDAASSPAPPGNYPANVTGNLRSGINYNVSPNAVYIRSDDNHSQLLELGTYKMLARPVIETVVSEERGVIDNILKHHGGRYLPLKRFR